MWLQGMALLVPQVQRSFALPVAQSGIIISSIFSGMLVGAISWGALSDRVGRKYAFHLTLPVSTLFGLLASIAPTIELLCLAVFGLGFGVGGHMPVDGCLFIEFCPKEHQSKLTFLSVFFQVGAVLSAVIMLTIVSVLPGGSWLGFESWRIVLVAQAAVSLLICTLIDLRESPKFLLAKDRRSEAVQALEHVAAVNGAAFTFTPEQINSLTLDELVDPGSADQGAEADSETGADTPLLGRPVQPSMFDSKYRTTTLLLFAIWILVALGYTMFNAFIAKFMESKGISTVPQSEFDVYLNCLVYAASAIPSAWIATWLVDTKTFQRRGTLASSAIASSAVLWMFVASSSQLAVLISSSLVNVFSAILYAVIYTYTPEVYPTSIRATANGTCSALGRM
nr:hypothetical protein HK105_005872 [Polyrhizophydium stewartii]